MLFLRKGQLKGWGELLTPDCYILDTAQEKIHRHMRKPPFQDEMVKHKQAYNKEAKPYGDGIGHGRNLTSRRSIA